MPRTRNRVCDCIGACPVRGQEVPVKARLFVFVPLIVFALVAGGFANRLGRSTAQDATPAASADGLLEVPFRDIGGRDVGIATLTDTPEGLSLSVSISGLTPGDHGIHFHEAGLCDPAGGAAFESARGHFNPAQKVHGGPPAAGVSVAEQARHAGDLGNLVADDAGLASLSITVPKVTLGPGPYSLADGDGTALIVHEGADDLMTDPSGNSGGRFACAVITGPQETDASPVASPETAGRPATAATPEATPAAASEGGLPTEVTVTSVDIAPGETAEVTINAPAGVYQYYCNVPGNAAAGQVGTLTVQ